MLLQTSIKPRREGVVIAIGLDRARLVFSPNAAGELESEVTHAATIAHLIGTQNFYPADEADFDAALKLSSTALATETEAPGPVGPVDLAALQQKTDAELDLDDDEGDPDAMPVEGPAAGLPIEANTPPQTAPDRAAKRNTALQAAGKARK